ncbi:MAG: iron ABC transporter permease [Spirochaetia bacterium]|jgi:iron(III) transport system permease protein|nr:iron ABC transporter permease [Spirochaetia bacterium]
MIKNENKRCLTLKVRHQLYRLRHDPTPIIAFILVAALTYLVLGPLLALLSEGFRVQFRDAARIASEKGSLTIYYFKRVFTSPISETLFWMPLQRSLKIAIVALSGSIFLGFIIAWILVRTDCPGHNVFSKIMILPYIVPSWTFALAWITMFKNRRVAGTMGILETLGFSPPDWLAYGYFPITVTMIMSLFPLAFLLFGSTLQSVDVQLEESARMAGAPKRVILFKIVLPLLLPALMSSGLLIISRTIGSFGSPYLLGSPVRYSVLSTALYGAVQRGEQGIASVLTMVIVLIGIAVVSIDIFFVKEAKRFVTVSGKGSFQNRQKLGALKGPVLIFIVAIILISIVIPFLTLVLSTISIRMGVFKMDNFTLDYWISKSIPHLAGISGILRNSSVITSAWNSIRIVSIVALIAGTIGTFIGYVSVRYAGSRITTYLKHLSFLPYIIPTIGFGAAYLTLFAVQRGPIPSLYGTMYLIILAMSIKYLPFASRAGTAAMMQLGSEPEEAAMICGAPWRERFFKIVVPILRKTLVSGIVLPFISGMKELTLVIFLATPGLELMTTQVLRYIDYGYTQMANAVTVVIIIVIMTLTLMLQKITGSGITSGLRGN